MTQRKKQVIEKKENLEKILADITDDVSPINSAEEIIKELPKKTQRDLIDFNLLYSTCEERASEMIDSSVTFFFDENFQSHDYIQKKLYTDKLSITNILFQIEIAKYAIIRISEDLDQGSVDFKILRVLGELQTSQMNNTKHLVQVQTVIENSYRTIADELNVKRKLLAENNPTELLEASNESKSSYNVLGMGHKAMLMNLHKSTIEEAEIREIR